MRKSAAWSLAGVAVAMGLVAGAVDAGVPWWAHWWRDTNLPVANCALSAANAARSVTGAAPTILTLDRGTKLVRAFTADAGIIVHCTAGTATVCGRPKANLSITVFSNANNATAIRDQINAKFGNPVLFDCN